MENSDISKVLKSLVASRNKNDVLNNLSTLRGHTTDKKQFTIILKHGGISAVIGSLRKYSNNAQIISTSLSILGNCCTQRDCAKEVIKHNGIQILADILKNWSNDSIICRTFRIIGNIAQFDNYASEVHKYKIVPTVIQILNKSLEKHENQKDEISKVTKISMGTKSMGVRLLRILWNSYSNRENMLQDGAIRSVSRILMKYTEKWKINNYPESAKKEMEKFLNDILKALLIFSKMGTAECAKQILADGNGFKTLVLLIPVNPYVTVKCLTNLSHVATSRSDIANAEAVNCIIEKLRNNIEKHPNERYPNDVISAFCLFFKHPLNCSELKRAGGLELLLKMLQNCKSKKQEFMMSTALASIIYDRKEEETLLANGLVDVIINCIERNLKTNKELTEEHQYVKRKFGNLRKTISHRGKRKHIRERSPSEESSQSSSPKRHCLYGTFPFRGITPPDSDSSPPSSPLSMSSQSDDFYMDATDDSENYSPICSDFEDNTILKEELDKDVCHLNSDSETEIENEAAHINSIEIHEKIIHMMLTVLSNFFHRKPYLTTKRHLTVLLKYARECKNPSDNRITRLLWNIVSDGENLHFLIKYDLIKIIYSLTEKQHDISCAICYRLNWTGQKLLGHMTNLAENDVGQTVISNFMLADNFAEKQRCVINVPLIVKSKSLLLKIMETFEGLKILINCFEKHPELRYDITISFNKLSRSIHLNGPMVRFIPEEPYNFDEVYSCDPRTSDIVTIKLDDGSTIDVDRDFLIKQTHYFKVMLTGSFSESNQEMITLKNVSHDALQCLLNLLKTNYEKIVPQPLNVKLITILEVLVLADLYLLEKLTDWLSTCVIQFFLSSETAADIYNWSITSGTNLLRVETVAFILTFKMTDLDRYRLFDNIIESGFMSEIKDDVHSLISRYLKIR